MIFISFILLLPIASPLSPAETILENQLTKIVGYSQYENAEKLVGLFADFPKEKDLIEKMMAQFELLEFEVISAHFSNSEENEIIGKANCIEHVEEIKKVEMDFRIKKDINGEWKIMSDAKGIQRKMPVYCIFSFLYCYFARRLFE